jgi:CubicO group peptidase (beta-lactamase class C family)
MLKTTKTLGLIFFLAIITHAFQASSQALTSHQIDSIANKSLEIFPSAGVAVAVVKDGKVVHSAGYGYASMQNKQAVDENTLFAIASNSKAFTAAALAILIDEGKLNWKDRVVDHIPEFSMYDSYVREKFTVEDLLCHRSGLGLGAGDLMIFPDGGDYTIDDILKSFQYQKPVSDFRTKYDYDNLLYIVAGEIIHRISGMSWAEFVEQRIMKPLGMDRSVGSYERLNGAKNVALPHSSETGDLQLVDAYNCALTDAAGGINSSVKDVSKWLLMQLNGGKFGDKLDKQLFTEARQREMWDLHTMIRFSAKGNKRYQNHYKAYGLGWAIEDYKGYTVVSHTGGLPGMLSKTMMVPELDLGVVVLTNSLPGGNVYFTLPQAILDSYLGVEPMDWNAFSLDRMNKMQSNADSVVNAAWATVEKAKKIKVKHEDYVGTYKDDWFGKIKVTSKDGQLWFQSLRSPKLTGKMYFYKATTFAIKWDYEGMQCDAFATFNLDQEGKAISIKMKGISPNIDFSFDFQDLDLRRVD